MAHKSIRNDSYLRIFAWQPLPCFFESVFPFFVFSIHSCFSLSLFNVLIFISQEAEHRPSFATVKKSVVEFIGEDYDETFE